MTSIVRLSTSRSQARTNLSSAEPASVSLNGSELSVVYVTTVVIISASYYLKYNISFI